MLQKGLNMNQHRNKKLRRNVPPRRPDKRGLYAFVCVVDIILGMFLLGARVSTQAGVLGEIAYWGGILLLAVGIFGMALIALSEPPKGE